MHVTQMPRREFLSRIGGVAAGAPRNFENETVGLSIPALIRLSES
jgi:hypothetical protein